MKKEGGGDVCESNTPKTFCAPRNGFEGRGTHQGSIRLRFQVAAISLQQFNRAIRLSEVGRYAHRSSKLVAKLGLATVFVWYRVRARRVREYRQRAGLSR